MCIIRASSTAAPGGFGAIGAESSRIGGSLRVLSVHPTRFCVAKRLLYVKDFFARYLAYLRVLFSLYHSCRLPSSSHAVSHCNTRFSINHFHLIEKLHLVYSLQNKESSTARLSIHGCIITKAFVVG
jgi:hypothetical protein